MLEILKGLYDQARDPVLIQKDGEIVYKNSSAMSRNIHLPDELYNEPVPFVGGIILNETEYQVNATDADGYKVYVFYKLDNSFKMLFSSIGTSIKNSVMTIQIAADKIKNIEDEKSRRYHEALMHQVYSVNRLAGNMLRLGGADYNPESKLIDLVELYGELVNSVNVLINGNRAVVEFSASVQELNIKGNSGTLERLLLNLLSNSLKATDKNGKVTVTVKRHGNKAMITVKDNGKGIPEDILPSLFSSYEVERSLSDMHQSIGLGLSVVYDIVSGMGGSVVIKSNGGKGTVVTVSLPIQETEMVMRTPEPEYDSEGRSMRMLQTELSDVLTSDCYGEKFRD